MEDLNKLFGSFSRLKVVVIGDVMLDTYIWGHVERISPEAPVPVVALKSKEYRIGGAGNVALNCVALGARVNLLSVTGNDADGDHLKQLLQHNNIGTSAVIRTNKRITTSKTRIISKNQQMMRLDAEVTTDIDKPVSKALVAAFKKLTTSFKPDIVIFEDYNKGVLNEDVITSIIDHCRKKGIVTAVDPKRKNFFAYKSVDIFKPNLKEVKEGLNLLIDKLSEGTLNNIHKELNNILKNGITFITLSEHGVYYNDGKIQKIIPSHLRQIADVSGAGDTVIAVAALVYAVTKNAHLMAEVANIAGGLVCEEVGTAVISKEKLQHECELLLS